MIILADKNLKIVFLLQCDKKLNLIKILGQNNILLPLEKGSSVYSLISSYNSNNFLGNAVTHENGVFFPGVNILNNGKKINMNLLISQYYDNFIIYAFTANCLDYCDIFLKLISKHKKSATLEKQKSNNLNIDFDSISLLNPNSDIERIALLNNELINAKRELYKKNMENIRIIKKQNEMYQQLEDLIAIKDRLFSIIAHDLRNPLTGIVSILELFEIRKDLTIEKKEALLRKMYTTAKNSVNLMENLFEWAMVQRNKSNFQPSIFDVEEIALQEIDRLMVSLKNKGLDIYTDFIPVNKVFAETNSIATIIRNLLYNAIKFTPENGKIIIKVMEEEDFVKLLVIDNGIGMSEDKLKRLFSFGLNNNSLGTNGETGSGFGLSVCKELAEKNSCMLYVKSTLGQGTEFCVTIPIAKSETSEFTY